MQECPGGVLAAGPRGKQGAQSWAPAPGRVAPHLSAAAELCSILSPEEEMIHQWMELCSLLWASEDCWKQLGAAKADLYLLFCKKPLLHLCAGRLTQPCVVAVVQQRTPRASSSSRQGDSAL